MYGCYGGKRKGVCSHFLCPRSTRETLVTWLVEEFLEPGTVILSDKFSPYFNLNDISYTHLMVNHCENFVDLYTEAHSNTTEGVWNAVGYPSKHWNSDLILPNTGILTLSFQTLEFWPYYSKHWHCDLILLNIGILTLYFQTLEFWPYPSKHWNWVQVLLQTGPLLRLGSKGFYRWDRY